jgi:hypothetical protein
MANSENSSKVDPENVEVVHEDEREVGTNN